jgi:hypothetical protein
MGDFVRYVPENVPQGLKPSRLWFSTARLKPCPSFSELFRSPQISKIYFSHLSILYNSDVVLAGGRKLCNI